MAVNFVSQIGIVGWNQHKQISSLVNQEHNQSLGGVTSHFKVNCWRNINRTTYTPIYILAIWISMCSLVLQFKEVQNMRAKFDSSYTFIYMYTRLSKFLQPEICKGV